MIKKAVKFFSRGLEEGNERNIETDLELINFGRKSFFITFYGKHFEFSQTKDLEDRGNAIGRPNDAFVSDIVAAYLDGIEIHIFQQYHICKIF